MQPDQRLTQLIKSSFGYQRLIFFGMGIVAVLTGVAILILSFTMPPQPGEETIVLVLQGVAVVFILFGIWSGWYVRRRESQVLRLIFEHPEEIERIQGATVQRRGVNGRAIRIHTKDKKMVGFNVNGPQNQQELMDLLRQHLKAAGVISE